MRDVNKVSAAKELQLLVEDLKDVMDEDALSSHPKIKELRAQLESWSVRAQDAAHDVKERTKRVAKMADNYAHEEPWYLLGAGVAIGVVIGALLRR